MIKDRIDEYQRKSGKVVVEKYLDEAVRAFTWAVRRQFMEDRRNEPGKMYATAVTQACARKSAYKYYGFPPEEEMSPRSVRNYFGGDVVELTTLLLARLAGVDIATPYELLKATSPEQVREKMSAVYAGETLTCYPDGLVNDGTVMRNLEIKKLPDRTFDKMEKDGIVGDEWGYRTQIMLEINSWRNKGFDINETCFVGLRGLTGHLLEIIVPYEEDLVAKAFDRRRQVVTASPTSLPERGYAAVEEVVTSRKKNVAPQKTGRLKLGMQCAYCDWKGICWAAAGYAISIVFKGKYPTFYLSKATPNGKDTAEPIALETEVASAEEDNDVAW